MGGCLSSCASCACDASGAGERKAHYKINDELGGLTSVRGGGAGGGAGGGGVGGAGAGVGGASGLAVVVDIDKLIAEWDVVWQRDGLSAQRWMPTIPFDEEIRLKALRDYDVRFDSGEAVFTLLAQLAAAITQCPVAMITLLDHKDAWIKAGAGIDRGRLPRELVLCSHALHRPDETFVLSDTKKDAQFAGHPLVDGAHARVRFYAGAPLRSPLASHLSSAVAGPNAAAHGLGVALGTICVWDTVPRTLNEWQKRALQVLARQVVAELELRRRAGKNLHSADARADKCARVAAILFPSRNKQQFLAQQAAQAAQLAQAQAQSVADAAARAAAGSTATGTAGAAAAGTAPAAAAAPAAASSATAATTATGAGLGAGAQATGATASPVPGSGPLRKRQLNMSAGAARSSSPVPQEKSNDGNGDTAAGDRSVLRLDVKRDDSKSTLLQLTPLDTKVPALPLPAVGGAATGAGGSAGDASNNHTPTHFATLNPMALAGSGGGGGGGGGNGGGMGTATNSAPGTAPATARAAGTTGGGAAADETVLGSPSSLAASRELTHVPHPGQVVGGERERDDAHGRFYELLDTAEGQEMFLMFLSREFVTEALLFWEAVETYTSAPHVELARAIYDLYLSPNAVLEVNVPAPTQQRIARAVESGRYTVGMFNGAQLEVFGLMSRDAYQRFEQTDRYKSFHARRALKFAVAAAVAAVVAAKAQASSPPTPTAAAAVTVPFHAPGQPAHAQAQQPQRPATPPGPGVGVPATRDVKPAARTATSTPVHGPVTLEMIAPPKPLDTTTTNPAPLPLPPLSNVRNGSVVSGLKVTPPPGGIGLGLGLSSALNGLNASAISYRAEHLSALNERARSVRFV